MEQRVAIADKSRQYKRREGFLHRLFLWGAALAGIMMIAWPSGESLYGYWSQYQLRAAFERERHNAASIQQTGRNIEAATNPLNLEAVHKASGQVGIFQPNRKQAHEKKARLPEARSSSRQQAKTANRATLHAALLNQPKRWQPTQIGIPAIDLEAVVVRGVSKAALRRGPGHDPATALPGQSGNCVIAAHRNAYGWWFHRLDEIEEGDLIHLKTPQNSFIYQVALRRIVDVRDTEILNAPPPAAAPRLTLYTCTLPKSRQRLVVVANLISP